jgi:hypothetical protein
MLHAQAKQAPYRADGLGIMSSRSFAIRARRRELLAQALELR